MMIGIKQIASFIPPNRTDNFVAMKNFELDESFITQKIGVRERSLSGGMTGVQMAKEAIQKLNVNYEDLQLIVVVTQNPDYKIPHMAAILHNEFSCHSGCMTFDVSQGCAGYVYGLNIVKSMMLANNLNNGLLVTVDPYSRIIDSNDKSTALLFGDAATATLLSTDTPCMKINEFTFGTVPDSWQNLTCRHEGSLHMNGREIYNFVLRSVMPCIKECLAKNDKLANDIDSWLFHQASKFVIDTLRKRLKLTEEQAPFIVQNYGNTISSSIPLLLESYWKGSSDCFLLSGFGVGLTHSSVVLERV